MHKLRILLGPLRVFDAVVRTGGVTRTSDVLHVTPGAVSLQLKQLEGSLGVALFQKEGREIKLTEVGRQLARRVADSFDRIENALTDGTDKAFLPREAKYRPAIAVSTRVLTWGFAKTLDLLSCLAGSPPKFAVHEDDFRCAGYARRRTTAQRS